MRNQIILQCYGAESRCTWGVAQEDDVPRLCYGKRGIFYSREEAFYETKYEIKDQKDDSSSQKDGEEKKEQTGTLLSIIHIFVPTVMATCKIVSKFSYVLSMLYEDRK